MDGQTRPMIISRTPLRISIGGGGTDLPSYYRNFGGFVIAAAINKHIYVGINETFGGGYFLKYSSLEHAVSIDEIRHSLIREVLKLHEVPTGTVLARHVRNFADQSSRRTTR